MFELSSTGFAAQKILQRPARGGCFHSEPLRIQHPPCSPIDDLLLITMFEGQGQAGVAYPAIIPFKKPNLCLRGHLNQYFADILVGRRTSPFQQAQSLPQISLSVVYRGQMDQWRDGSDMVGARRLHNG